MPSNLFSRCAAAVLGFAVGGAVMWLAIVMGVFFVGGSALVLLGYEAAAHALLAAVNPYGIPALLVGAGFGAGALFAKPELLVKEGRKFQSPVVA